MTRALNSLIESPQNNLKIFKNGQSVFADGNSAHDFEELAREVFSNSEHARQDLIDLIISALLNRVGGEASAAADELPTNCVLRKVLDLQILHKVKIIPASMNHSINSIFPQEALPLVAEQYTNDGIELPNLNDHFSGLSSKIIGAKSSDRKINFECLGSEGLSAAEMYELGATALDCSIMCTFKELTEKPSARAFRSSTNIHQNGRWFSSEVHLIDLDPKPWRPHFRKYSAKTLSSYEALTCHEKQCESLSE